MEYIFVPLSDDVRVEKLFSRHFRLFPVIWLWGRPFGRLSPSAGSGGEGLTGVAGVLLGWLRAFVPGFCLNCDSCDYGISLIFAGRLMMAGFWGAGDCSFYVREASPGLSSGKCQ